MAGIEASIAEGFAEQLGLALEGMLGAPWAVSVDGESTASAIPATSSPHVWAQVLSIQPEAVLRIAVADRTWRMIGSAALDTAGIDGASSDDVLSTYTEILTQAVSGLCRLLSAQFSIEVSPGAGTHEDTLPGRHQWFSLSAASPSGSQGKILFGVANTLAASLDPKASPSPERADTSEREAPATDSRLPVPWVDAVPSRLDLLMDVEMPVSVSFGRTQLPLKEVIKLTTGSIVELNRSISEPVEVIVNNCVIARGEVVVVEGNYGVRIHQIVSRAERIRSLD